MAADASLTSIHSDSPVSSFTPLRPTRGTTALPREDLRGGTRARGETRAATELDATANIFVVRAAALRVVE